ncbi:hypothetical protein [Haladaptatus caseinilyticus]|uniref:hypothetical protein n=1 Tax=Haladaptatus caseinilyticus TaxID=2993314 RepID=UPI00224BA194|nr:hypothetical protein [Haladaptatus caseinilyticus]
MGSTDQRLVAELENRVETLLLDDAVRLVELRHADEGQGIQREMLDDYLDQIGYGMDAFPSSLEDLLTESESWQGDRKIYQLDGDRVSVYPARWHDRLRDTTDLREYLRVIDSDGFGTDDSSRGQITEDGVAEELLLDVAVAIGGMDRDDGREQLKQLRDEGDVAEYPSQHANPWVQLT